MSTLDERGTIGRLIVGVLIGLIVGFGIGYVLLSSQIEEWKGKYYSIKGELEDTVSRYYDLLELFTLHLPFFMERCFHKRATAAKKMAAMGGKKPEWLNRC